MKRTIFIMLLSVIFLSACGSNNLSDRDIQACDIYQSTVDSATNKTIDDDEMMDKLNKAYDKADSDKMMDMLDDLLIYFEDGNGDLDDIVKKINAYCPKE